MELGHWVIVLSLVCTVPTVAQETVQKERDYQQEARKTAATELKVPLDAIRIHGELIPPPEHKSWHQPTGEGLSLAAIRGEIVGPSNKAIEGARVLVTSTPSQREWVVFSDSEGKFHIEGLEVGSYILRIESPLRVTLVTKTALPSGRESFYRFKMKPGSPEQTEDPGNGWTELPRIAVGPIVRIQAEVDVCGGRRVHFIENAARLLDDFQVSVDDAQPEGEECQWARNQIRQFFLAVLDVSKGTERIKSYYSPRLQTDLFHDEWEKQIQPLERHELAAVYLDYLALGGWFALEQIPLPNPEGWPELTEDMTLGLREMKDSTEKMRAELRRRGLLEGKHVEAVLQFLYDLLWGGPVLRHELEPRSPPAYAVGFTGLYFGFANEDGQFRLVYAVCTN